MAVAEMNPLTREEAIALHDSEAIALVTESYRGKK